MGSKMTPEAQDLEAQKQDLAPIGINGEPINVNVMKKGIMARRNNFMDHGDNRFPMSRDFGLADMPCAMNDCVANNGSGKCIVPSFIEIDADGKCAGYQPVEPDKKKGKK